MQQSDFEKVLADTLAAHGRSLRTQETYTLMLRLFGRYLRQVHIGKALDAVVPEDVEAYQRYLVTERKVGFSSFNQSTCALRFFYRTCLDKSDWTIARMPFQTKAAGSPRDPVPRGGRRDLRRLPQPEAQGAAHDLVQRWPAPGRDPRPAPQRHRQHEDDDPDRAGQGTQGPLRDALQDPPRRATGLLEGVPSRPLALRRAKIRRALVALDRGEGLHHRRRSGRDHQRASRFTRSVTPSRPTSSREAPTSA